MTDFHEDHCTGSCFEDVAPPESHDPETGICSVCNGSGEGQYEGWTCPSCGGSGSEPTPESEGGEA